MCGSSSNGSFWSTKQKVHARRQLDGLVRQLADAAPAEELNASEETEPTDATILLSLPGIGTGVLATLFAEASDVLQRRDYAALVGWRRLPAVRARARS